MSIGVNTYVVFLHIRTFVFKKSLTTGFDLCIIQGKKEKKDCLK